MKKITKSLLLSTCFLFELATFTHATRISELFENEDVLHFCKLAEKLINFNSSSSELNEILQPGAIHRRYEYSCSKPSQSYDHCELFCTIKLCKDILLEGLDDARFFMFFFTAFYCFNTRLFISRCLTNIEDISQDDIDFLNSPFHMHIKEIIHKISSKYSRTNPSDTQQAPKKSSCTIL